MADLRLPTLQNAKQLFDAYNNISDPTAQQFVEKVFGITPSGLTTLQTDSAQQGANLGAELTSASGWTSTNWTGDYNAGFDHNTGNTSPLTFAFTTAGIKRYLVSFTVSGRTAGSFTVTVGGVANNENFIATNKCSIITTGAGNLIFTPTSDFDGTISAISMKLVTVSEAVYIILDSTEVVSYQQRATLASLFNIFMGKNAGGSNTTGNYNLAVGPDALSSNTTGGFNVALGGDALRENVLGDGNVGVGTGAMYVNTNGSNNVAVGGSSMTFNGSGNRNAALGQQSLRYNEAGSDNVALGSRAGSFITGGASHNTDPNRSIYIGAQALAKTASETNEIVIGSNATGNGSHTMTFGSAEIIGNYFNGPLILAAMAGLPNLQLAVTGAPSPLADGMMWREDNTDTGLKIRVGGATKTVTLA